MSKLPIILLSDIIEKCENKYKHFNFEEITASLVSHDKNIKWLIEEEKLIGIEPDIFVRREKYNKIHNELLIELLEYVKEYPELIPFYIYVYCRLDEIDFGLEPFESFQEFVDIWHKQFPIKLNGTLQDIYYKEVEKQYNIVVECDFCSGTFFSIYEFKKHKRLSLEEHIAYKEEVEKDKQEMTKDIRDFMKKQYIKKVKEGKIKELKEVKP